jgi:hypothetical protein
MPDAEEKQSYLELFDISKKEQVARAPLASIKHIPRTGERVFLPLHRPGDWEAFRVVAVEYFLGGEPSVSRGSLDELGLVRITLYVEQSK